MTVFLFLSCFLYIAFILSIQAVRFAIFTSISSKFDADLLEWINYHKSVGFVQFYINDALNDNKYTDLTTGSEDAITLLRGVDTNRLQDSMLEDTIICFLATNEYMVVPTHNNIQDLPMERGNISFSVSSFDLVSNSDSYYPDFPLRGSTLRTKEPVSNKFCVYFPYNKSIEGSSIGLSAVDKVSAYVVRLSLPSREEHRWQVERLCSVNPMADDLSDTRNYHSLCGLQSLLPPDSWRLHFNLYHDELRQRYTDQGLVEDTNAWNAFKRSQKSEPEPFVPADSLYTEEQLYRDVFLTISEPSTPDMVLGSFKYTPLHEGEEVSTMTVYGDRDVPLQFVQFCIDHDVTECYHLTNYAMPTFEQELKRNPRYLLGTSLQNIVDHDYLNALLDYNYALRLRVPSELVKKWKAIHARAKLEHPEECYRGWRSGESMLMQMPSPLVKQLPRFVMYVLHHDDVSVHQLNDALFEGDVQNSNGLIVPINVSTTVFFEYIAFREQLNQRYVKEWKDLQYVGITTYKTVVAYNTLCTYELQRLLKVASEKDYDVIPLVRTNDELLMSSVLSHRRTFRTAWDAVLLALGYDVPTIRKYDRIKPFYRSSMFIKPSWLVKLNQFLSRAMEAILLDPTLYALCSEEAGYQYSNEHVSKRVFNSTTYQLFPFLLERLQSFYFAAEEAYVCQGNEDCPYESFW